MTRRNIPAVAAALAALFVFEGGAHARDISGTIGTTLTVTEDSRLVGDVTCTVSGAACLAFGASGVTLDLNGFTMTGLGDSQTGCGGTQTAGEFGIDVNGQKGILIRGPGVVQRFRFEGLRILNSTGVTVTGLTVSTNCRSGIFVSGGSENLVENNVSVRNGNLTTPCGGIWLTGGTVRNRLRANRTSGNGYTAQGNNFGIGLVAAGVNDNVVEDNVSVGNTNGIYLAAGTERNTVRRNLLAGNPAVQVAVDHSADGGFDIKNLAAPGANVFDNNVCLTATNAPCPELQPSLTASPNPIPVTGSVPYGMTTLSWTAPAGHFVEVHIGSPDGALFAFTGDRGSAQTGLWVPDILTFYLQDVTGGRPLTAENTLATLVVRLQRR